MIDRSHASALIHAVARSARVMRAPPRPSAGLAWLWLACAAVGCDDQVSPFYRGESLFTLSGNVEITGQHAQGELVPALAFVSSDTAEVRILEVDVQGSFPSDFRLDVYEPPPTDAFTTLDGGERIALGYVTAVPRQHKSVIELAEENSTTLAAPCTSGPCDTPAEITDSWCTRGEMPRCYIEHRVCPGGDPESPDCKITSEGDATLKEPWRDFSGFSQNYMLVYLEQAAKAGTWLSAMLGDGAPLARGYHLLHLLPPPTREAYDAREACVAQADDMVAAAYNSEHGTSFTTDEVEGGCEFNPCAPNQTNCDAHEIGLCALPDADRARIARDLAQLKEQTSIALGCLKLARSFELVTDPKHASISVVIGADSPPQLEREPIADPDMDGPQGP